MDFKLKGWDLLYLAYVYSHILVSRSDVDPSAGSKLLPRDKIVIVTTMGMFDEQKIFLCLLY
jgi:hypothetical protein